MSKKKPAQHYTERVFAEREGFEPPDLLQSTVFKTAAFDHSAISLWSIVGAKLGRIFYVSILFAEKLF
jgi:hypothetical protein